MTKIAAAAALAFASTGASAAALDWTGGFDMYDPTGAQMDANGAGAGMTAYTTGQVDLVAGTFTLASTNPFSGLNWTAWGGTLYGEGTHTISTVDATCNGYMLCASGANITFTVGAGQIGGVIDFGWGATGGIDVVNVWDISYAPGTMAFMSTDIDGDGIPGIGMVDGPFPGFSASFNFYPCLSCEWVDPGIVPDVPETSTYAMMLGGLGLVGAAAARRRRVAANPKGMAASDFQKP